MKYSLRSLMIVVLVAPAAIGILAWLFLPPRDPTWWTWSKEKASLDYSIKEHLPDYEVEHVVDDEFRSDFYSRINIRSKDDRKVVYSLKNGHDSTVFARWNDILYIAEYSPIAMTQDSRIPAGGSLRR